ncbi:hypothetical protein MRX96_013190 [Rhipicephalus microplus]
MNHATAGDKFQALPILFGAVSEPRQGTAGLSSNAEVRPQATFHHFRLQYPRLIGRRKWAPRYPSLGLFLFVPFLGCCAPEATGSCRRDEESQRQSHDPRSVIHTTFAVRHSDVRVAPEDITNLDPPKETAPSLPPLGPEAAVVAKTTTSRQVKRRSGEQSAVGCGGCSGCHHGCHKWRRGTMPPQEQNLSVLRKQNERPASHVSRPPFQAAALSKSPPRHHCLYREAHARTCTCICVQQRSLRSQDRVTTPKMPRRINNMAFTKSSSEPSSGNSSYNGGDKAFR